MADARARPAAPALAETAAAADAAAPWRTVRFGLPDDATGWVRCAEVDSAFVARWEGAVAELLVHDHGRTDAMAAAGFVLAWYAALPGAVGGAFFRLARRVPRLGRDSLAFRCSPEGRYPDGVAVLDPRFWCLPDDPAATGGAATVVPDDHALGAVLREQVRAHADAFLAGYRPGARLPRRALLGAFTDGLDTGIWTAGAAGGRPELLADAVLALPGGTSGLPDRSSLELLVDGHGREHVTRTGIACCYFYKVAAGGALCPTCPRISADERLRHYTGLPDEG